MYFFTDRKSGLADIAPRNRARLSTYSRFSIFSITLLLLIPFTLAEAAPLDNAASAPSVAPAQQPFYVQATGHSLIAPILSFYTRTGGQDRYGQPLSEPIFDHNHYVQYFERGLLEFDPNYDGTDQAVKALPLGQTVATAAKVEVTPVSPEQPAGVWYFPDTGHSLRGGFLDYWRNSGEDAYTNLGQPISEELNDTANDGTLLTVQYFQNVRLERTATAPDGPVTISNLGTAQAQHDLTAAQLAPVSQDQITAHRTVRVPSLMFHYVRLVDPKVDPLGYDLSIKPDTYNKFMDWVKDNDYHTVTVAQVYDYLKYGIALPAKPVSIRWDDGHDDNWQVYQEMKKRGLTATFYVITRRLELTPAQWQQIDQDGFEVAAHTRTHPDLKGVSNLTDEITGSKTDLEAMLGHPVRDFAYPYGSYSNRIEQAVRNSGFDMAVTTDGGYTWSADKPFEEPTVSVTGNDTIETFANKIKNASIVPAKK